SVFWSAAATDLSGDVAFTVAVMFGASAAAVASIVHLLITRIRRQTRQARLTATLAASVARTGSFDEDLPEVLALTSAVLGGATVALSRVDPERIVVPLGVHESPSFRRAVLGKNSDRAFDEEVLVAVVDRLPFILLVGWPGLSVRRQVSP